MHRIEQETVINYNAEEKLVSVSTSDPTQIRRLDALVEKYPDIYKYVNSEYYKGEEITKKYTFPKKYLSFRKPVIMSEERREELRTQLQNAREKQNV